MLLITYHYYQVYKCESMNQALHALIVQLLSCELANDLGLPGLRLQRIPLQLGLHRHQKDTTSMVSASLVVEEISAGMQCSLEHGKAMVIINGLLLLINPPGALLPAARPPQPPR